MSAELICDSSRAQSVLTRQILSLIETWPEGTPISADDLAHLDDRHLVGRALARLTAQKRMLRMRQGVYLLPVQGRFGPRAPAVQDVLQGLMRKTGEVIVSSPATAANALGASLQVPMKHVFLTSGRTRRFFLGELTVDLRHAAAWQLLLPDSVAGDVLRCLIWCGRSAASSELRRLRKVIPKLEFDALTAVAARLPKWLAVEICTRSPYSAKSDYSLSAADRRMR